MTEHFNFNEIFIRQPFRPKVLYEAEFAFLLAIYLPKPIQQAGLRVSRDN